MRRARFAAAIAVAGAVAIGGYAAHARAAAPDVDIGTRARDAYDRGTVAYARGDFATAAREFTSADALVPNPSALQAALDAAVRADDPVLGMTLLERARARPAAPESELAALVKTATTRFAGRTGRVRIVCGAVACLGAIDGAPVDVGAPLYVRVGTRTVTLQSAGTSEQRLVEVRADVLVDVAPAPPAPLTPLSPTPIEPAAPRPSSSSARVVAPVWFYTGVGLTAVLAGATIASGLDAASQHRAFVGSGCDHVVAAGCDRASSDGASAQLRTNVLIGATAGAGLVTAALGIFFVRWQSDTAVAVGVLHGVPTLVLRSMW